MESTTIEIEFDLPSPIDGERYYYLDVEFTGEPHSVDIGEDGGEYWGFKYSSTTRIVQSCEDTIEWDKTKYSDSENTIIEKYLEDYYDKIDDKICGN
jgi:hypothetical protein